ncbi:MAG: RICIN domain-containing protein [Verrucomicrobiota bacterium]
MKKLRASVRPPLVALAMSAGLGFSVSAQDRTLLFSPADAGVAKPVPVWGLDTAWLSADNVRRGALFMGTPQVDVIRFSFTGDWPLTNGDLGAAALAEFNDRLAIVNAYTDSHAALYLNNDSPSYDASFVGGDGRVEPVAWATLINATRQRCVNAGRTVLAVSPYNEPDNSSEQGSVTRLGDVCWQLRNTFGANFGGIKIYGASVLNPDHAGAWYDTLNGWGYLEAGCTHQLAGSFDSYAGFFQNVETNGDLGVNDELHNVMEAMVGAEYGMDAGIWWGTAERARGEFVKASDGQRLAYAEHRANWTAAAVYRGTNGAVQAFVGESERQSLPTTYRFFARDRDVFYDGDGPRRDFTVTTTGDGTYWSAAHHNAERVVNITWGEDVPPLIHGRYHIVNRNSGKVLQVPGSSLANGVQLTQNTFTNGLNQQWDVNPLPNTWGGDYSYVTIKAAHSGVTMDLNAFSYANGAAVQQWNGGTNAVEQWYLQYITNGYFKIRSRWSNKVVGVNGASTANGAGILQWDDNGTLDHEWRFVPVGSSPTNFTAPPVVAGLSAAANNRSVQLNWTASPATNLYGYTVLRATNSGGPFETVARGLATNTFTDKLANQPRNYYYVVKAMDRSWNVSASSAQVLAQPTGGKGLIARYSFEGTLSDTSGNANHPIATNGAVAFAAGKFGSALTNDGSSQSFMLPANLLAGVTNFTIAAWVHWNGGGAWQRIFDFGNGTGEYLFLTPSSGNGTLRFAITTNSSGGEQIVETSPLSTGAWQHVAVTRSAGVLKLYKNGLPAATNSAATLAPAGFNPVLNYLGKSQWPDPLFGGRLDEVNLFNYALSDAEIARLTNNLPPPPNIPTVLSATVAGSDLSLSWPTNYLGSRLESNAVSLLATGSWFTVASSANTNRVTVPVQTTRTNVFFRLVYP